MLCLCSFNIMGVYVTKLINAQGRCLMSTTRGFLIWFIGLIINFAGNDEYESTMWYIVLLKLFALSTLLFAVLFYSEMICKQKA